MREEDPASEPHQRSNARYNLRANIPKKSPSKYRSYNFTFVRAIARWGNDARKAIIKELGGMLYKKVFHPRKKTTLNAAEQRRIISCSLFVREKFYGDGSLQKLKARMVAGGHLQDRSEYADLSSPTACKTALFSVAAIAAKEGRHVVTADIGMAYLNAPLKGDIKPLMRIPRNLAEVLCELDKEYILYVNEDGSIIVQLDKALYGCVESALVWYEHLRDTLISIGYVVNPVEPCCFNKLVEGTQCTIIIHVDDLFITCADMAIIDDTLTQLTQKYEDLTINKGLVHDYLGMVFDFSLEGKVSISMRKFIDDLARDSWVT